MRAGWSWLGVVALGLGAGACGSGEVTVAPSAPARSAFVDLGPAVPWSISSSLGSIWLQTSGDRSGVTEVRDGEVAAFIAVPGGGAIAAGAGSVWSAVTTMPRQRGYEVPDGEAKLARIDPVDKRIAATISLGEGSAVDVVANDDRVWVAVEIHDGPGRVVEVDPASNRVVREIPLGTGASALALGGSALWAATGPAAGGGSRAVRIDPSTGRRTGSTELDGRIDALAASDSMVWATTGSAPEEQSAVTSIDPVSLEARFTVDLDGQMGSDLGVADGSVWVSLWKNSGDDYFPAAAASVVQIDERTGAVEQHLSLGDGIAPGVLVLGPQLVAMVFESVADGQPNAELQIIDP